MKTGLQNLVTRNIVFILILILSNTTTKAQSNVCDTTPPFLILTNFSNYGRPLSNTLIKHLPYIETLPFDGMTINTPESWYAMQPGYTASYSSLKNWLAPIKGKFTKFKQNFFAVFVDKPADLFDDWTQCIDNWKTIAQVAKEEGFVGIFFDNEEYFGKLWDYPDNVKYTGKTLQEYRDQSNLRGKQIMQAMLTVFPELKIIFLHGPYLSENKPSYVSMNQANGPSSYELLGPFFVGMVEAMGSKSMVIDGGEVYQYRTKTDFQQSYDWRKYTIASTTQNSPNIPISLRPQWPNKVGIAFGTFDQTWPYPSDSMNPSIMRTTIVNALSRTDRYVWYYTEDTTCLITNKFKPAWRDSIKSARDAVKKLCLATQINSIGIYKNDLIIYPNPTTSTATIKYTLLENSNIKINVFDVLGKQVMNVLNEKQNAGKYELNLNLENLSDGIYFLKVYNNGVNQISKIIKN